MKEPQTNPAAPAPDQHQNKFPSELRRLPLRLVAPNFLTGFGAAILIPYMNVFFKDRFQISDSLMGIIFGLSSLFIGIGSILGPRLTTVMGSKIRAIVLTQFSSIVFLLLVGFSGSLWVAGISILLRSALMNMSAPLYNAFCMEQTPEHRQGFISSILNIAWQIGWSVGPFISGLVQQAYGFAPLFIATTVLYLLAIALMWTFFSKTETQQ
jgi:predicted MFS family arabinose efflux permease